MGETSKGREYILYIILFLWLRRVFVKKKTELSACAVKDKPFRMKAVFFLLGRKEDADFPSRMTDRVVGLKEFIGRFKLWWGLLHTSTRFKTDELEPEQTSFGIWSDRTENVGSPRLKTAPFTASLRIPKKHQRRLDPLITGVR